ncbi:zinc finger protein 26-like [Sardina pilchardus]|uniref:zinc finger protein 26-like n=1 Tax=Sardina pilchardus TaxID=27697 RepID=UPI002E108FFF
MNEDLRIFQTQFASIMEILLSAAMAETAKLYESCVLELRAEMSRVQAENNTLKCRIIQTLEGSEGNPVHSEEWISENSYRPPTSKTESSLAEIIITQEQLEGKEGAPFIKEEASDSKELDGISRTPPEVHIETQTQLTANQNGACRPPPSPTGSECKTEIKVESSPQPVTMEMRIVTLEQSSAGAAPLQKVSHKTRVSPDPSDRAHPPYRQHSISHGRPQTARMAPLSPTGNTLTMDISTRHFGHQSEEQRSYNTSLPLPNRPPLPTFNGSATRTLQKTMPVRHLPLSAFPGGGQHRCVNCGKTFHSQQGLCGHQQVHQGERRHQCSQCGKSFLYQSRLTHHLKSHSGKDAHSCTFCHRKFISKANLNLHLVSHSKEHPFECSVCGLTFGNRAVLHSHRKTHSGEPRYTCAQCGKKFLDLGNFSRHKRIHTGERPYSCEVCGKSFIQSAHLKKHILIHR